MPPMPPNLRGTTRCLIWRCSVKAPCDCTLRRELRCGTTQCCLPEALPLTTARRGAPLPAYPTPREADTCGGLPTPQSSRITLCCTLPATVPSGSIAVRI
eukprot:scaffold56028_cov23-Prasinocladus_malaysianus.AAC.1